MAKARVKLNLPGINQMLREAQPEVDRIAQQMAGNAGPGYEAVSSPHRWTGRAYVQTTDYESMLDNARNNTLARVFGSVNGG